MGKTLVAYFSASGVTKKLAQTLADAIGADLFAIEPKVPYTRADLNWMDKQSRSTIEMQNPASRPEIAGTCANIADYDTVFVGFPHLVVCRADHRQHVSGELRSDGQDCRSVCHLRRQRHGRHKQGPRAQLHGRTSARRQGLPQQHEHGYPARVGQDAEISRIYKTSPRCGGGWFCVCCNFSGLVEGADDIGPHGQYVFVSFHKK